MTQPECSAAEWRAELARVLASDGFARNARLSLFLRFIVERHLENRAEELKEFVIGVEVFGRRPEHYDPKLDSIVRTEALRLRSRLAEYYAAEGAANPFRIEVPKGGYIPVIRPRDGAGVEVVGVDVAGAASVAERESRPRGRWRLWAAAAGIAMVGTAVALLVLPRLHHTPVRIAVMPLQSLSAGVDDGYFADGLTDEIIRNFSTIDGLSVRSRTSSFAFKGQPLNVREIGSQLEVDYLVDGSVLRAGAALRIDVQVIRVRDDVPVWSGRFDRQLTDIFAVQDEIAHGIVNNLRLHVGRGRRRYEASADAYAQYLVARARRLDPVNGWQAIVDGFEQVIQKDPSFAPAYAELASTYALRSVQFPVDHAPDELTRLRALAERALALDPLMAEAYEALGLADARDGEWTKAEERFRRAIELDRDRSATYANFATWVLFVRGRNDEALSQLRRAEAIDPLAVEIQAPFGRVLTAIGRPEEAMSHCLRIPAGDSLREQCLARAHLAQEKYDEAIATLSQAPGLATNPQMRGLLGYAYARSGRRDEARRMAEASSFANEQALIFVGLGDRDRTFAALERMHALGPQRLGMYLNGPEMALVRSDPRVFALRKKLGLL